MHAFWNLASLLLGVLSWVLPLRYCVRLRTSNPPRIVPVVLSSCTACALALLCQLFYIHHKVILRDWSALLDTMDAVVIAAVTLLVGTTICNLLAANLHRKNFPSG